MKYFSHFPARLDRKDRALHRKDPALDQKHRALDRNDATLHRKHAALRLSVR